MRTTPLLLAALALAGCAAPGGAPNGTTTAPYAGLDESPVRGLSPDEIASLETGAGMRLALPAELNGYAGPKHVLELADRLGLDAEQKARMQELHDRTNAAARAQGEVVLERFRALDAAFRSRGIDEAALHALVGELAQAEGELRFVHLRAHLEADALLTPHQRVLYSELRGYGSGGHGDHPHG